MSKSIVFYGWYGAGNLGDELLLASLLNWARINNIKPVVISYDVAYTQRIHDVKSIDVEDVPGIVNAVAQSAACVLGGGGIFQTHHEFSYAGLFHFGGGDIAAYARPLLLAQQLGVPSLLIGQGVGPLDHDAAQDIVCGVFNKAQLVTVRDAASRELLAKVGVNREVMMAPDLVWTIPINIQEDPEQREPDRIRIALVIRAWFKSPGYEERMISAIKLAIDPLRYTLVWIPFQNHSIPYRASSDIGFVQQCMDKLGSEWEQELITEDEPDGIIHALSSCDAVVAMRLHAQILGFKLGKPTLSVEYDRKMTELAAQVQQAAALRIRPEDCVQVWQRALACLCGTNSFPGFQYEKVKELESAALQHFRYLDNFIATLTTTETLKPRIRLQDINWFEYWLIWIGNQIKNRNNQNLAKRDEQVVSLNEALTKRDKEINSVNLTLSECNEQIISLNEALTKRDKEINSLNLTLSEREKKIVSLNEALNECDEKITGLNKSLFERERENVYLHRNLIGMTKSISWRITSPIRYSKKKAIVSFRAAYKIARMLFWGLPAGLRRRLYDHKAAFLRFIRRLRQSQSCCDSSVENSDLSWNQFFSQVFSQKDRFKGVFVQELVIDWNVPLFQRPQHISAALGKLGYLVIYRTDNWAGDNVNGFREVSKNVWLTNNRHELERLGVGVRSFYSTAYANTPELLMKNGKRGLLVYEYIDHIDPEISGEEENIERLLALKKFAFNGGADFILTSAKRLYDEAVKSVGEQRVLYLPNGVDTGHYRSPTEHIVDLPPTFTTFKGSYANIVGYFGAIAPWLWYDAINELVKLRPDLGFIFIGPDYYGGSAKLPKDANVLYLGAVDYNILPAYSRHFDVCFIPFKSGDIAKTTSPLKLFEYFALEKPVVVTADMDECTIYPEVFRGNTVNELNHAIDQAIQVKEHEEFKHRLRILADQNDWIQRARAMEVLFGAKVK